MSHAYYSLYCKQRELQQRWEPHWACGFASLVTCLRILGDRTTESHELVAKFRESGQEPHDGMSSDDAVKLAQSLSYRAVKSPASTTRDGSAFAQWMRHKWKNFVPVMISVDSNRGQGEANHWWTVYGDANESNVWVMEPLEDKQPFECLSLSEIIAAASCDDGEGYIEYDGVAVSTALDSTMTGIPPSAKLMEFLGEMQRYGTGWTSQAVAAALVDNHFSTLDSLESEGQARGAKAVLVADLLGKPGAVNEVIGEWDVFFSERQMANMEALRSVLCDMEAHQGHKIAPSERDRAARDIALNLMLIGSNLMDG